MIEQGKGKKRGAQPLVYPGGDGRDLLVGTGSHDDGGWTESWVRTESGNEIRCVADRLIYVQPVGIGLLGFRFYEV